MELAELGNRLADSERKVEHLENELLALKEKPYRSPAKSVEFLNRTTDLEDSHERVSCICTSILINLSFNGVFCFPVFFLLQLLQFLKQLESRLPVNQSIFLQMSVADRRDFILGTVYIDSLFSGKYIIYGKY